MSNSPLLSQKTDLISYDVMVGGTNIKDKYSVYSIEVNKEINRVATAGIYVLDGNLSKEEFKVLDTDTFKPGNEVEVKAGYHQKNQTIFKGIIVKTGIRVKHKQHSMLYVECSDKAVKMTLDRKNEYFLDMKDSDVIQKIAGNYEISPSVKSTDFKHKEIIQYYASDWDFILSRAEVNGRIVITDDSDLKVKKPETSGAKIGLKFGTDIIKTDLYLEGKNQITSVECSAWDMASQKIIKSTSSEPSVNGQGSVKGQDLAGKFMQKDMKMHLTGPLDKQMLKAWADAKLLKSRLSRIKGSITFQGHAKVKPDTLIDLKAVGKYFEGEAYVSGVSHDIREGNWITTAKIGLSTDWFTATTSQVHGPAASGLLPGVEGLYNGVVKKIHDDPDGDTRILVDVPVIKEAGDGVWARIANFYATNKGGSFFMPEEKDEVVLGFLHNDPRFPVILGSMYGKKKETPDDHGKNHIVPDSDNSVKAIITKNQLKIVFEDKNKNIIIQTPDEREIRISDEDDEITITDKDKRNVVTMDKNGITMEAKKDIKISAKGDIEIDARGKIKITGRSITVESQMNTEISAGMSAKLSSSAGTKVESSAITTVKGSIVTIN